VSLHHGTAETGDSSEPLDLTGKITALVTVTDGDGDHVSATTDIGDQIQFLDDGPTASITASGSVTIDESTGQQADDTTDAAVSGLFAGVGNPGSDPTQLPQYATQTGLVSSATSSFGADNENGTTAFSLALNGASGLNSGLTTTDGHQIFLFKEGNLIVGRYETDGVGGITTADAAAFAIAINTTSGQVSLAQYVSLHHGTIDGPSPSDSSEPLDLTGKINAVVTVTDGDGDFTSASTDIGDQIQFLDDGPTASIAASGSVTIDESTGQ